MGGARVLENRGWRALLSLVRTLATGNIGVFASYAATLIVDGLLIAFVATTIAPIADYFLDKNFAHPSGITAKYIEYLAAAGFRPSLEVFLSIFVLASGVKAISSALLYYFGRKLAYLVVHDLNRNCLSAFLSSSYLFFLSHPLGKLQNTLQRETGNLGDGIAAAFMLIASVMQILMLTYVAWLLSYTMVLICGFLVMLFMLITRGANRYIHHFSSLTTTTGNVLVQSLIESLAGAKLILAYGRGPAMLGKYTKAYSNHAGVAILSQTLANAVPTFYGAFGIFSASLALYVSISGGENLPTLVAALWTLLRIVPLVSQFLANTATITMVMPSFAQYNDLLQAAAKLSLESGSIKYANFRQGIDLKDVVFRYPERDDALAGISMRIPKGSFTAFVGESGSGKSTTADMLLRLLEPDSGEISVDSVPLRKLDTTSFLERVGYVPQESFLFNASIRENLIWASPRSSDAEIWESLRSANIDGFVRALPGELDAVVGDRGVALSGGQRQRIALARALLKRPDILILDEATSALDSDSERLIMQSIDAIAPFTTIVVIAHRLSTVARADHVCVFSGGRIVESGSYAQLSAKPDSRLAGLIAAQQLG